MRKTTLNTILNIIILFMKIIMTAKLLFLCILNK